MNNITIWLDPIQKIDRTKSFARPKYEIRLFTLERKARLDSIKVDKNQILNYSKIDLKQDSASIQTLIDRYNYKQAYLENWVTFLKTTKISFNQSDLGIYILMAFAFQSMQLIEQLTKQNITLNDNNFPTYQFINTYQDILKRRRQSKKSSTYLQWFISIQYKCIDVAHVWKKLSNPLSFVIPLVKVLCTLKQFTLQHLKQLQQLLKKNNQDVNKTIDMIFNPQELQLPVEIIEYLFEKQIIKEDDTRNTLEKKKRLLEREEETMERQREEIQKTLEEMREMLKRKTAKYFRESFKNMIKQENLLVGEKLDEMEVEEDNFDQEMRNERQGKVNQERLQYAEPDYDEKSRFKESNYDKWNDDKPNYDKSNYDKSGYNKSGYNKSGYNKSSYDNSAYNKGYGRLQDSNNSREHEKPKSINGYREKIQKKNVEESSYFQKSFQLHNYGQGPKREQQRSVYQPEQPNKQSEINYPNSSFISEDKSFSRPRAGIQIVSIGKTIRHASKAQNCPNARGVTLECNDTVCVTCIFNRYMETTNDFYSIQTNQLDWSKCEKKSLGPAVDCWMCRQPLTEKDVRDINKQLRK